MSAIVAVSPTAIGTRRTAASARAAARNGTAKIAAAKNTISTSWKLAIAIAAASSPAASQTAFIV